jgi:hypothetical protein
MVVFSDSPSATGLFLGSRLTNHRILASMPADETKKRKACQSCTRSKAKCSPFEDRSDLCYRCQRLGKSCVFEETARKKAPKSRSYVPESSIAPSPRQELTFSRRVKQLEQRVDTLIDLLAANGQNFGITQQTDGVSYVAPSASENVVGQAVDATDGSSPLSTDKVQENTERSEPYMTPAETPQSPAVDAFSPYDPVEAGVLSPNDASNLLKEFGESFTRSFPFVIVPASTDIGALRRNAPFLFHCIMTVATYRTPAIQQLLNKELKEQIATRIVRQSHKSLEILQGLLIYGSWLVMFDGDMDPGFRD